MITMIKELFVFDKAITKFFIGLLKHKEDIEIDYEDSSLSAVVLRDKVRNKTYCINICSYSFCKEVYMVDDCTVKYVYRNNAALLEGTPNALVSMAMYFAFVQPYRKYLKATEKKEIEEAQKPFLDIYK